MQSPNTQNRVVWLLRWTARLLSLVSIAILVMFLAADLPIPGRVHAREFVGLAFFPTGVIAGMLVAWRREGMGAIIGLASLACFYVVYGMWLRNSGALGWWFVVFSSPLLLFLITRLLSRNQARGAASK